MNIYKIPKKSKNFELARLKCKTTHIISKRSKIV